MTVALSKSVTLKAERFEPPLSVWTFSNDGASTITVKVNDVSAQILAGEVVGHEDFGPLRQLDVETGSVAWRLFGG